MDVIYREFNIISILDRPLYSLLTEDSNNFKFQNHRKHGKSSIATGNMLDNYNS